MSGDIVHTPTVRAGAVGPGAPGHRIFESNFVVECPCGFRGNVASIHESVAHESAARHLRDVETGWWTPPGYVPPDVDFERDITYVVEYDEVTRRRCEVTITYDADRTAGSTAAAIRYAVEHGDYWHNEVDHNDITITKWRRE